MTRKEQQLKIASILIDLGLDSELIETMTALTKDEIKNVNN